MDIIRKKRILGEKIEPTFRSPASAIFRSPLSVEGKMTNRLRPSVSTLLCFDAQDESSMPKIDAPSSLRTRASCNYITFLYSVSLSLCLSLSLSLPPSLSLSVSRSLSLFLTWCVSEPWRSRSSRMTPSWNHASSARCATLHRRLGAFLLSTTVRMNVVPS